MFKKNKKSILNAALPTSQPQARTMPMQSMSKAPAITKQLLAKFENKYASASKLKSPKPKDSDISDSEQSAGQETVDVKTKPTDDDVNEEAVYESDFETSDSEVSENEKPTALNQTHLENVHSYLPESIAKISNEPVHENILTFEDLVKNNENQIKHSVDEFTRANQIVNNEHKDSELLGSEIGETFSNDEVRTDCDTQQEKPPIQQSKTNAPKFTTESVLFNENIVSFNELLANNANPIAALEKQVLKTNDNSGRDSKTKTSAEIEQEVELSSTKYPVEDCLSSLAKPNVEVRSAKQIHSVRKEEVSNQNISSPLKVISSSPANPTQEKEHRTKAESKRKNVQQTLEERRRLERMFFLVEKQSLQGAVEQPVFSPLVMSWEREAEAAEKAFDSTLASPEDAFAEMLRLRLRLTRDKMAAEYAAYRSCCAATQILASSHHPVTLEATKQIISQLKQPDDHRADT